MCASVSDPDGLYSPAPCIRLEQKRGRGVGPVWGFRVVDVLLLSHNCLISTTFHFVLFMKTFLTVQNLLFVIFYLNICLFAKPFTAQLTKTLEFVSSDH